jgi:hypothetical protein
VGPGIRSPGAGAARLDLDCRRVSREGLRTVGLAAGLALLVLVPLGVWGVSALSEDESGELTVETLAAPPGGNPQIVVSLPSEDVNVPETVDGARSVSLACLAQGGEVEFRVEHLFPFTDTDDGTEPPHVHQTVSSEQLEAIDSCRLEGTAVELEGELQSAESSDPPDSPLDTPEF